MYTHVLLFPIVFGSEPEYHYRCGFFGKRVKLSEQESFFSSTTALP